MHSGRLLPWRPVGFAFVFSQLMEHLPAKAFRRCVRRYGGARHVQSFTCLDQFLCLAFAQLTHRESLRDIEVCLRAHRQKLYHMGIRGGMARNTLANANRKRDWRIHADFAQALIRIARPLYAGEDLGLELDNTVYALDSSTVAELYRYRWHVELFFKWIKQHLRIKSFLGASENAVKTQLWNAVAMYVLVAIVKKRLNIAADLYTILQILSLTLFDKIALNQLLANTNAQRKTSTQLTN